MKGFNPTYHIAVILMLFLIISCSTPSSHRKTPIAYRTTEEACTPGNYIRVLNGGVMVPATVISYQPIPKNKDLLTLELECEIKIDGAWSSTKIPLVSIETDAARAFKEKSDKEYVESQKYIREQEKKRQANNPKVEEPSAMDAFSKKMDDIRQKQLKDMQYEKKMKDISTYSTTDEDRERIRKSK